MQKTIQLNLRSWSKKNVVFFIRLRLYLGIQLHTKTPTPCDCDSATLALMQRPLSVVVCRCSRGPIDALISEVWCRALIVALPCQTTVYCLIVLPAVKTMRPRTRERY